MKLSYSKRAIRQIGEALNYIAQRSPAGAANIEARIAAVLAAVQVQPFVGTQTEIPAVRRIFLTPFPYLIDYQIKDDEIVVLRFRHASRNPASIPGLA